MTPRIIEIFGAEPLTVAQCRKHLEQPEYGDSELDLLDDAQIEDWLAAAREHCEDFLGLSLTTRVLEIALDEFPRRYPSHPYHHRHAQAVDPLSIVLPGGPVRQVLSVSWGDESDNELNDDAFTLDLYRAPAALTPVSGSWPTVTRATNVVKIRYLAGYGVDSDGGQALPAVLRSAILLVLGELYANRENAGDVQLFEIPTSAQALMRPRRVRLGMA
jgi:uncharacterized phiE125 gp8 family phage protein